MTVDINEAIRQSAMIAGVHTSSWTARAKDTKAAISAAQAVGAAAGAYTTHKNLMYGHDKRLKAVRAAQANARNIHTEMTLPWGSESAGKGLRMLPVVNFEDYMKRVGKARDEFHEALKEFLDHYADDSAQAAEKLNLSGNELLMYPKAEKLRDAFKVRVEIQPIPAGTSFQGLPPGVSQQLSEAYEDRMTEKVRQAMTTAYERTKVTLESFANRVQGDRMRTSSWTMVEDLPRMLRHFNLMGSQEAEDFASAIERELVDPYDYESCKDKSLKEFLADKSNALAEQADMLMGDGSDMDISE